MLLTKLPLGVTMTDQSGHIMPFCSETCLTTAVFVAGVLLVTWAALRERRWMKAMDVPLIPTTPIMFLGAVLALLALVHLLTLAGAAVP